MFINPRNITIPGMYIYIERETERERQRETERDRDIYLGTNKVTSFIIYPIFLDKVLSKI